jgi:phosphatidylserine decarboxylase
MAGFPVALVPVAAILVAGIRLRFLNQALRDHDGTRRIFPCDAAISKGDEMGWFEHGSTIVVFAPAGFRVCDTVQQGATIRMGERLIQIPV